jgi:hypothetical protein
MNLDKLGVLLILLLVIYVVIDAIAFSAPEATAEPLDHREKALIFVALAIGLFTFFSTVVTVEPAVLGRSGWSALNFVSALRDGTFPPSKGGGLGIVLVDITLAYLLMLAATIAFCFSQSRKLLKMIGLFGCLLGIEALGWGEQSFKGMFFGFSAQGSVSYGPAMYGISLAVAALLLVSL